MVRCGLPLCSSHACHTNFVALQSKAWMPVHCLAACALILPILPESDKGACLGSCGMVDRPHLPALPGL